MSQSSKAWIAAWLLFLCFFALAPFGYAQGAYKAIELTEQLDRLWREGRYSEAIPIAQKALAIREKALGPDHLDVAESLYYLAILFYRLGQYEQAEPLFKRALAIREKALGPNHPAVAQVLNGLMMLYGDQFRYAESEPLGKRVLAIREKALGPDHPDVAMSLNNIAYLYRMQGKNVQAEPLLRRALEITEKALGPSHLNMSYTLNNLALVYQIQGQYVQAESLFKRALAIREKALGPDHPDVATCLNLLAGFYQSQGQYALAEPLHKRSLAIWEKAFGQDHPSVAESTFNQANFYSMQGQNNQAKPLYARALATWEKTIGPDFPMVAACLRGLAWSEQASGRFNEAHALLKRAQVIDEKFIEQIMSFSSEEQMLNFHAMKQGALYSFLSLVEQYLRDDGSCRKDALDVWLRRKGSILEAQQRFQEAVIYSGDVEAVKTFQELAKVRSNISRLAFTGIRRESLEAHRKKMTDLNARKQDLEAKLSRLSQTFATSQKVLKADSGQVAGALPAGTILIDFARFKQTNFKSEGWPTWLPAHYIAFLLPAGKADQVKMIDLGDAVAIDEAVKRLKQDIQDQKGIEPGSQQLNSARKTCDLVFEPLRNELGGVKEVFISPDGNLNLIPFEVLQGPDGRYLIEDYTFYYLSSGRDILGFGAPKAEAGKALLMGDPDFDLGDKDRNSIIKKLALAEPTRDQAEKRSSDIRGFNFSRLPGTRTEVEDIQKLFGSDRAELYTGKEAIEEVLQKKGAPRILHLATHGFFLSDLEIADPDEREPFRGMDQALAAPRLGGKAMRIENPLLRSGIALAGANNALKQGDDTKSDGLVTAEKILGLRLRGTEMVVLSACSTGVGEVKSGEGVYGLRRAFTQAGARSLVMSMWSVPDKETAELMTAFYQNVESGKMNRCQALRQAALKQIEVVKGRYGAAHPFFWGAFVFLGEP